ncbi:FAD-dependent oxidoreductase [Streptosporangium roseum]|uniref:Monooxygenase FAD-binding protein n=1 Tax=Streptosporangium roseum (strain ATCC 12428 / DSM 43021 / JCM 3005 / KCTC 9067 / NCIMB 10171 / NRRL 2505 / NI 9100) TaxID=479432 RepID=D2BDD9_STRRD|nr:FAD-dependent oxidoreductase [Streptosporangium roseum]ACZ86228.1 monooxygenase FAD-binding protein [Streptosporangium roseum DSM 43021]
MDQNTCVIAGGGPAGAVLALLLARAGVQVTLLEKHGDFLRDFRGDTVHPSTLQVLDELGLAEELDRLPHRKAYSMTLQTDDATVPIADLSRLPGRYNYIAFVPQWDFLNLVTAAAKRYPTFRLVMNAEVHDVIREGNAVRGVRYRDTGGEHELRAALTVAADGRHSDVRRAAGLVPVEHGVPMDVLWFRLPREPGDPGDPFLRVSAGHMMVAINREDYWQLAYLIPKGGFDSLRARGIETVREHVARLLPFLKERVELLSGFGDVSVLSVALNRLRRWHRPGLLVIGDAAHAMSPVFGVGINLAVQDAVAAANLLAGPLAAGAGIPESLLARVQRRRTPPTVLTQLAQRLVQHRLIRPALSGEAGPVRLPRDISRIPVIGALARRFIGFGVRPEHVGSPVESHHA